MTLRETGLGRGPCFPTRRVRVRAGCPVVSRAPRALRLPRPGHRLAGRIDSGPRQAAPRTVRGADAARRAVRAPGVRRDGVRHRATLAHAVDGPERACESTALPGRRPIAVPRTRRAEGPAKAATLRRATAGAGHDPPALSRP